MKTKWTMGAMLLLLASCTHSGAPGYMRNAGNVRILLPDNSLSHVLSAAESKALVNTFDGRLFTNGQRMTEAERMEREPILTVAYPYPRGETHIHVYSDGRAGYLRTMLSYEVYPMKRYCTEATDLAMKHGLILGTEGANHGTE